MKCGHHETLTDVSSDYHKGKPQCVLADINREPACVMAYSHDGFGLGHLSTNTNIAARLVPRHPRFKRDVSCLVRAELFRVAPGVDFIKIPSIVKVDTGVHQPLKSPNKFREDKSSSCFHNIERGGDLSAALFSWITCLPGSGLNFFLHWKCCGSGKSTPKFLRMRELRHPEVVREQWKRQDIYKAIALITTKFDLRMPKRVRCGLGIRVGVELPAGSVTPGMFAPGND